MLTIVSYSPCSDTSGCPRHKEYGLWSFLKKVQILFQCWLVLRYMVRTDTAKHKEICWQKAEIDSYSADSFGEMMFLCASAHSEGLGDNRGLSQRVFLW